MGGYDLIRQAGARRAKQDAMIVDLATTATVSSKTGTPTIDGATPAAGYRILLKDESTANLNGVWQLPAGGGSWRWIAQPLAVAVLNGSANKLTWWFLTSANTYEQAGGAGVSVAKAASTANVASLSGTTTIDGVALSAGDLVLLKNQSTASQNGLYKVQSGAWTNQGQPAFVVVSGGTLSGRTSFVLTAANTYSGMSGFWI